MKNTKKLLCIITVSLLLIVLVACGGHDAPPTAPAPAPDTGAAATAPDQPDEPDQPAESDQENVTVVFWDMMSGNELYPAAASLHAELIRHDYPHITIDYQSIPWADRHATFVTAITAGIGPDFSNGGGYQSFQFYAMGEILDISWLLEYFDELGILQYYDQGQLEYFRVGDSQVGIPIGMDPRFMIYRADWFEEAGIPTPQTWEDIYNAAVYFTDPDAGVYGLVFPSEGADGNVLFFTWFGMNGTGIWSADGTSPDWVNPANVEIVEFIRRLNDAGVLPSGMSAYNNSDVIRMATTDSAAMAIISSGGTGSAISATHYGQFMLLPTMPAGPSANGRNAGIASMNAYMAYSQTDHPLETMQALGWWARNFFYLRTDPEIGVGGALPRSDWNTDPRLLDGTGDLFLRDYMAAGRMPETHTLVFPAASIDCWLTQNVIDSERWWMRLSQEILTTNTPALELLQQFQIEAEELVASFR
ncbi:MAG: extracellular solute-binding protein [Oscillospiraceae bacterium]|nr:extracellular solute-binding protein [Oscillospiraceae bacterium]